MLKGLLKILAVLAVLIALVVWTCDFWCFWMVKGYLMKRGYGCTAERFDIGFWPPRLEIEDLVLMRDGTKLTLSRTFWDHMAPWL